MFHAQPPGIAFVPAEPIAKRDGPDCSSEYIEDAAELSEGFLRNLHKYAESFRNALGHVQLGHIRTDKSRILAVIKRQLLKIVTDPDTMWVSMSLSPAGMPPLRSAYLEVCQWPGTMDAKLLAKVDQADYGPAATWTREHRILSNRTVWLREDTAFVARLMDVGGIRQVVTELVHEQPNAHEIMVEHQYQGCVCEDGCKMSAPADTEIKPTFWCWVRSDSVQYCRAEGKPVHKNEKGRYWSKAICSSRRARCACSKWGFEFGSEDKETNKEAMKGLPRDHYGGSCKAWTNNKPEWCFVGWDNTCADQFCGESKQPDCGGSGGLRMPMKSYLACAKEKPWQQNVRRIAGERCVFAMLFVRIWCVVSVCTAFPVTWIIFWFMKNGCQQEVMWCASMEVLSDDDGDLDDS